MLSADEFVHCLSLPRVPVLFNQQKRPKQPSVHSYRLSSLGQYCLDKNICREEDHFIRISIPPTHTHPFNGPLFGTTWVSRYQKGKTNLDFTEARDSEWQWHQLGYMQVCTSLQTDNHASTSLVRTGRMPFLPPNQQRKALKAHELLYHQGLKYILCKFVSHTASVRLVTALNEQMWIHKLYRYSKFDMNRPIEALHKPTSTHTQTFNGPLSGTTRVSW